jgi:transcriptional regulator with XRE-family HTH domain
MALALDQQQWIAVMNPDENQYFKAMGRRVAQRRNELGLTQVQLAEALNVAQQTYAGYETGNRRIPVSLLPALARALKVETDILLGDDTGKARSKRGPAPKFQHHIEQISALPKAKQRMVLEVLEAVLAQQSR